MVVPISAATTLRNLGARKKPSPCLGPFIMQLAVCGPRPDVGEARLLRPKAVTISSMNLTAKTFVPASDFERAKQFYAALRFEIPWSSENLAYVRHGQTAFLLQAFNSRDCQKVGGQAGNAATTRHALGLGVGTGSGP